MVMGARGARVDPVVRPDTTDGDAGLAAVTDGTGATVATPRPKDALVMVAAEPDVPTCHARGNDARTIGVPSRTFGMIDSSWLRGY